MGIIFIMNKRPPKDQYYLNIAREVAQRSTCFRRKFGAIIVKDDVIVATGYVGAPRKTKDCFERGSCLRDQLGIKPGERYELCRSCHAEMNCFLNAARSGTGVLAGDMFLYGEDRNGERINALPCFVCKKMIINAGLNRVVCSTKNDNLKIFQVSDWVRDWQESDITDDKYQYGESCGKIS